jgi:hypothetical protein
MKLSPIILSWILVLGLSACKTVETPNGKVPSEYLDQAKSLEGNYLGTWNGVPSELSLKFNGDTPVLTYTDFAGHDLLGLGCGSEIGQLAGVSLDPLANIQNAYFVLIQGKCFVEGQVVALDFKNQNDDALIDVSVVKSHEVIHIPGQEICYNNALGGYACSVTLEHDETVYDTLQGQFKKVK